MATLKKIGTYVVLAIVAVYLLVSIIHMSNVNDNINELRAEYRLIHKDLKAFTEISSPSMIQVYVEELENVLDNITFLSKIVESGELADEGINKILKGHKDLEHRINMLINNKEYSDAKIVLNSAHIDSLISKNIISKRDYDSLEAKVNRHYIAFIRKADTMNVARQEISNMLKTMNKKKFFHTHKE